MFLLCLFFSYNDLGNNSFSKREQTSELMSKYWPLTEPSLTLGRQSTDKEIQQRSLKATPKWWLDFISLNHNKYWALQLVIHDDPNNYNNLPWANITFATLISSKGVREELTNLSYKLKLRKYNDLFEFECENNKDKYPAGLDNLRFRYRRIPLASDLFWSQGELEFMKEAWFQIRKGTYKWSLD